MRSAICGHSRNIPAFSDHEAGSVEVFRHAGPLILPVEEEMVITSERLQLRPPGLTDCEFFVRVTTAADRLPLQLAVELSKEVVALRVSELFRKGAPRHSYGIFVIWRGETSIGMLYLRPTDLILRHAMLGIDLLHEFQSQGYGSEAARAAMGFMETSSNLVKISAGCFSESCVPPHVGEGGDDIPGHRKEVLVQR